MTKKTIVKASALAMLISLVLVILYKDTSGDSFLTFFYLPVEILFNFADKLSMSTHPITSRMSSVIIILAVFAPLIHLYFTKEDVLKDLWFPISGGLIIVLLLVLGYFNNSFFPIFTIEPLLASQLILRVVASGWYLVVALIYYFVYFKNLNSFEAVRNMMTIVISLIVIGMIGGFTYDFFKWVITMETTPYEWSIVTLLKVIYEVLVVRLLWKFHSLIDKTRDEWTQIDFLKKLGDFKKSAKLFLNYTIIYALVQVFSRMATLKYATTMDLDITFPFIEFGIVLTIVFFVEILTYTIHIKKDNDGFI